MSSPTDYKVLIRQFGIFLLIILALYLALVRPLAQQGVKLLENQIEETVEQLTGQLPQNGAPLATAESLRSIQNYLAQSQENYNILKNFLDPDKEYLPEETAEAGLYFIEQLHIITKRLKRQANSLKIRIPDNFGFTEEMPEDTAKVVLLLKELEMVDRLTSMLMEQGVEEISLVKPLSPIEQREQNTQELLYCELPIQLSFLCNSPALIKLLYEMKNFSPALMVKDIVIRRAEEKFLQVEMLLGRLVIS